LGSNSSTANRRAPYWTVFLVLASHWPGLGPAADRLSCCTTRKSAKKRTPLSRPLRGCPLSGSVRRGLRKLALRAQTCAALVPPAEPSSRRARGERKCRLPTVRANSSVRRDSMHRKSPFRPRRAAHRQAGQSFARRMTGVARSPSLLTFLATQESQSPARGEGGASRSMLRAAVAGRVCKPGRGKIPANLTPNTGTPARKSPTQETPLFAPACTQPGARRRTRVNTAR